jgi:phosphoribosylglycinamide formyltransferase-1
MSGDGPRLGVLLSGGGRTLQNLIDRIAAGRLAATIACVISDRPGVQGLERARRAGLPTFVERDGAATFARLREHRVQLVCLAGYLRLLPIPDDFAGAVLNIHPALLPRHGGQGCHGERVHRAVLAAGDRESGCTVHYCSDRYDEGPILLQRRVPVLPGDTVTTLAERVFAAECEAYPDAIAAWARTHGTGAGPPGS